jgi:hypothetical protein
MKSGTPLPVDKEWVEHGMAVVPTRRGDADELCHGWVARALTGALGRFYDGGSHMAEVHTAALTHLRSRLPNAPGLPLMLHAPASKQAASGSRGAGPPSKHARSAPPAEASAGGRSSGAAAAAAAAAVGDSGGPSQPRAPSPAAQALARSSGAAAAAAAAAAGGTDGPSQQRALSPAALARVLAQLFPPASAGEEEGSEEEEEEEDEGEEDEGETTDSEVTL